jgi:predicted transposase/invertase (TIGR01784 family)
MQFVDITNDVAFRKIFGNEKKKIILISFLNAVINLQGNQRIADISIANPYQLPILPNMKTSIIDVKATDKKGNTFIVEMQVADVNAMDKRLLYYTSKEYSQQIVSGDKYTELKPVIFIGIFDFRFTNSPAYLSHHAVCNVETGERVIKDMNFYFIELPKFVKTPDELHSIVDKWVYFIKEAENLDVIPNNLNDEGLTEAYQDANRNTWTKEELDAYNYTAMREQDERGREQAAEMRGMEKGIDKERHRGIEKALKRGKLSVEEIAEDFETTIDTVIQIKKQLEK